MHPLEFPRSEIIGVNQLNFEGVFSPKSAEFSTKKVLTKIQFSKNKGLISTQKIKSFLKYVSMRVIKPWLAIRLKKAIFGVKKISLNIDLTQ